MSGKTIFVFSAGTQLLTFLDGTLIDIWISLSSTVVLGHVCALYRAVQGSGSHKRVDFEVINRMVIGFSEFDK
jgi:hypothetical protein